MSKTADRCTKTLQSVWMVTGHGGLWAEFTMLSASPKVLSPYVIARLHVARYELEKDILSSESNMIVEIPLVTPSGLVDESVYTFRWVVTGK